MTMTAVAHDVRLINITLISPPTWNSRTQKTGELGKEDTADLARLAESLRTEGLLQPIEVEELPDGKYELVIGSRRLAAATAIGWSQIPAIIRPASSEAERAIRNGVENVKRKNLTTFEEGRLVKKLRDSGLNIKDVASKLGFSDSKASNLYAMASNLPEPVLKEWQKGHPVASFDVLRELANKKTYETPEKQVKAWDDAVADAAAVEAETGKKAGKRGKGKKPGGGGTSGYSIVQAHVEVVVSYVKRAKKTPEKLGGTKQWTAHLIDYMLGQRPTPPEGIVPEDGDKGWRALYYPKGK